MAKQNKKEKKRKSSLANYIYYFSFKMNKHTVISLFENILSCKCSFYISNAHKVPLNIGNLLTQSQLKSYLPTGNGGTLISG